MCAWTIATLVERQIGRRPRAFRRVAARCPFGAPAVTEQEPYDADGAPFPTTYYLTCPHLVAAVSRLEAAGGVERWSAAVADEPRAARRSRGGDRGAAAHPARARRGAGREPITVRRSTAGIGGSPQPGAAQVPARARRVRARAAGLPPRRARPRRDPRAVAAAALLLPCRRPTAREHRSRGRPPRLGGRVPPLRARLAGTRHPGRAAPRRSSRSSSAELRRRVRRHLHARASSPTPTRAPDAWILQAVEEQAADARLGADRSRWSATPPSTSTRAARSTTRRERRAPARRRPPRRSPWPRRVVVAVAVVLVFALGVALGQALNDGPPPPATRDLRPDARADAAAAGGRRRARRLRALRRPAAARRR